MTVPRRGGFSLVELLVVLAIIGVLVGLLVPAVQRVRDTAARAACGNNLRQIGLALHGHHDTHRSFPPAVRGLAADYPFLSWHARILPFVERGPPSTNSPCSQSSRPTRGWGLCCHSTPVRPTRASSPWPSRKASWSLLPLT
jgi:prepilin-type N-terminal cleavage/methylation domain-containing protein